MVLFDQGFTLESPTTSSDAVISGSVTSTGSFTRLDARSFVGPATLITNLNFGTDTISGSAQIASDVSGSFNKGFVYNGEIKSTSIGAWSEVADINTGRDYQSSAGSAGGTVDASKSALIFGGRTAPTYHGVDLTEEWNGTAWTEVNDLLHPRTHGGGFGSTEAAVSVGGGEPPSTSGHSTCTEEFGGTNWSEGEAFPTPAGGIMSTAGTLTSGMVVNGGYSPGTAGGIYHGNASTETVNYDGTDWSAGANLNVSMAMGSAGGTQNSALAFGGRVSPSNDGHACTEEYNGAGDTWSVAANMIYKRADFGEMLQVPMML